MDNDVFKLTLENDLVVNAWINQSELLMLNWYLKMSESNNLSINRINKKLREKIYNENRIKNRR